MVTKAANAGLPFNIGMYLVAVGIYLLLPHLLRSSDGTIVEKDVCCISPERQEVSRFLRLFIVWQCSSAVPGLPKTNLAGWQISPMH